MYFGLYFDWRKEKIELRGLLLCLVSKNKSQVLLVASIGMQRRSYDDAFTIACGLAFCMTLLAKHAPSCFLVVLRAHSIDPDTSLLYSTKQTPFFYLDLSVSVTSRTRFNHYLTDFTG